MRIGDWWRKRARERRRKKAAAEHQHEPLREFVYLDEVSVFSLLASRIGALVTDLTETETSSLNTELKGTTGASVPVAKAEVSSAISSGETRGTQVMRKSTVQSTFRELYGYVRDSLVLRPLHETDRSPSVSALRDVEREAERTSDWAVKIDRLRRGELLEVEVQLEADESFRASVIFSTMLEFIEDLPQLPETVDTAGLLDAITGTRILDRLLAGLVPMRGKVLDYGLVTVDGSDLIVHRRLLEQLPADSVEVCPLYVVGVAEEGLFWRDIRRVLFSGARYRMLCRVGRDGAHTHWTPVKLVEVLGGVAAGLRTMVEAIPGLLRQISDPQGDDVPAEAMRRALIGYAELVSNAYGHPLTADELTARGLPTAEQCALSATLEERREAFGMVTGALAEEFGFTPDPRDLASFRAQALVEAGLMGGGTAATIDTVEDDGVRLPGGENVRYLDCEIVAVYW